MPAADRRITAITLALGLLFAGVFAGLVVLYGRDLRAEIRAKMIERDAAVLYPVAQQQIEPTASLAALLPDARRQGTLALAIFDESGIVLEKVPASQLFVELPFDDQVQLQDGRPLTRFHPAFPLSRLQPEAAPGQTSPVLEIILPLYQRSDDAPALLGFVRYHLDARPLAAELAALDASVRRKTLFALTLGAALIGLIVFAAHLALTRAQRTLAERNERLARTHFELTLAAKASALGQITSHLLHGLKGPVAGLQAVMASGDTAAGAGYTGRLQALIQETSEMLSDQTAQASYELTGDELTDLIRRRNAPLAAQHQVAFQVRGALARPLDSHRGGMLCLITNNLVQNALNATDQGRGVSVDLASDGTRVTVTIADEGRGIPEELRPHLFTPGRSGRAGGTGLGLALSRLLARQIGASLDLVSTGPQGTVFRLSLPLDPA